MYRTWVIARHTFFEALGQPIYSLLLTIGAAVLVIFMFLPFFTLGEDTIMFKAVGIDVITLLVLLATLFATSKSIHEEIEDRTMLTLMSKPVSRLEVLVGKYLGLIGSTLLGVILLGGLLCLCTWYRIPTDYQLSVRSIEPQNVAQLNILRSQHLAGLYPSLLLVWLQVSVLAAISVVISTRFSLVVNLPVVILIYIAGNLTRFVDDAVANGGALAKTFGYVATLLIPYLAVFDLRQYAIYGLIGFSGTAGETTSMFSPGFIWQNTALAAAYAVLYVTAVLTLGLLFFRHRELGGSEG